MPEHFNLPWHLALEQDAFDEICDSSVSVQFAEYGGGTGELTGALESGELDIAVVLFEGAVQKILNGGNYRIVKLFTDSALIWGIHVSADSDIESIEQARGKRYAISRMGSGSHLIAIVDAAERGWSTDNLQFVKIGNIDGARKSLAAEESDVFLWEKFMTKPLVDSGEFRRVADRIVPWPAFVIAVRDDVLRQHSKAVGEVLRVVSGVCQKLKDDPAGAEVIARRYDLQTEDAASWLERTDWNNDFRYPELAFNKVFESLKLLNLIQDDSATCKDAWFQL